MLQPESAGTGRGKLPGIRWMIAFMLFLAAILNYIDRQTLSILAPTIQKDLNLSEADYGQIVNLFLVAYTISLLVSGRLVDKLGTRLSMALFISWWSVANMLTGFARSLTSLCAFRFLLGFGEAGNWPSSTKAVGEWFPAKERAIAIGFYTMGATLGATIAPVLITFLVARWHWQAAFMATGALGLLWVGPWLWLYRRPQDHTRITARERALMNAGTEPAANEPAAPLVAETELQRWKAALARRDVWLLMIGRMLTDPVWFFYQFWFAKYLFSVRNVDQQGLKMTWVIYLAADIGALGGGFASAFLIKGGLKAAPSRLWVMAACALVMPASLLVARVPSVGLALALGMAVVLAHLAWLSNISALVVDLIPKRLIATCFGVVAAGSAVGGIMMNKSVVYLVQNYSYGHWFAIMALLHPLAWILLFAGGIHRCGQREA